MDACRFHHDIKMEKVNAISRFRRIQRLTILFRCVELGVFLVVLSRFSGRFAFSVNQSAEYLREVSSALISPRLVFLLGNMIVVALFFISGGFSHSNGEESPDFYEEYAEKCRRNQMIVKSDAYRLNRADRRLKKCNSQTLEAVARREQEFPRGERRLKKCHSQNLVAVPRREEEFPRRELRRNLTEKPHRKSSGKEVATYAEDEMSNEEFRRTVEAFIARQQRSLREEGEIPA